MADTKAAKDAAKEFLAELLAKVPEQQRAALEALGTVDEALEFLGSGVKRQSEFSSSMDTLAKERAYLEGKKAEYDEWWKRHNGMLTAGSGALAKLKALKDRGIDPDRPETFSRQDDDPDDRPNFNAAAFMTKEEFQEAMRSSLLATEQGGVALISKAVTIASKHQSEFGEPFDMQPVIDAAIKSGRPIEDEYNLLVQPKRQEKQQKDFDQKLKEAEERGAARERQRLSMPYDISNAEPNAPPTAFSGATSDGKGQGVQRAVDDWFQTQRSKSA